MMPLIGNQRQHPGAPMLYLVTGHLFLVIFLFSVFIHPEHLDPDYVRISTIATFLYLPFPLSFMFFASINESVDSNSFQAKFYVFRLHEYNE
jgi:hypothetical protein